MKKSTSDREENDNEINQKDKKLDITLTDTSLAWELILKESMLYFCGVVW